MGANVSPKTLVFPRFRAPHLHPGFVFLARNLLLRAPVQGEIAIFGKHFAREGQMRWRGGDFAGEFARRRVADLPHVNAERVASDAAKRGFGHPSSNGRCPRMPFAALCHSAFRIPHSALSTSPFILYSPADRLDRLFFAAQRPTFFTDHFMSSDPNSTPPSAETETPPSAPVSAQMPIAPSETAAAPHRRAIQRKAAANRARRRSRGSRLARSGRGWRCRESSRERRWCFRRR